MRRGKPLAAITGALVLTMPQATAYYHYVHYTSQTAPFTPIQEKFDLAALPGNTVTFFVSDAAPTQYSLNDSFPSVLSQIRQAAQAWNAVDTSELRVAFGGLSVTGTPQNSPGGEVVFEDMPPGVLAFAGHTSPAEVTSASAPNPGVPFVPILRSVIHLNRDLTRRPGPSYLESFFTTTVHEMGHALGLQHTFTSSAMSTSVTRATTRAQPLDADDIAGLSLLYPKASFASLFGSISGRVTSGGQGVHLASVVALRPNGSAVSAMTNPDGTYRIEGLPPDNYWVYVHPLPPTADVTLPLDPAGQPVPGSGPIETLFYPGTKDPLQFAPIAVNRGAPVTGIDFSVQRRASVAIYDVVTYSFFGQTPVSPAYLTPSTGPATIAVRGNGLVSGAAAAPGLNVHVLSGVAASGIRAYGAPQTTLAVDLVFSLFTGTGPRHLLFSLPNDIYVLPSGLNLVQKQPPMITSVTPVGDGTVTVAGTNLGPDSRIFFDGQPAAVRTPFTGDDLSGAVVVAPPPGANNQRATLTAFNADGQNSMFLQPQNPPVYAYDPADPPAVFFTPASLPAGSSAMIDITAVNTHFTEGQTTVGFGSTDVFVRRVWVLSPNHLWANVTLSPNAAQVASEASVITGFQVFSQPSAFQALPANPRLPTIGLPLANANPPQSGIYPGAAVSLFGSNLAVSANSVTITLADEPVQVLFASANQINFAVPAGMPTGPAILKLNNGLDNAFPVVVQIDLPPPVITGVLSSSNTPVDAAHPAQAGETVTALVQGLDPAVLAAPNRLRMIENGIELAVLSIASVSGQPNLFSLVVVLSPAVSGSQVPLSVAQDGASGNPILLPVRGS